MELLTEQFFRSPHMMRTSSADRSASCTFLPRVGCVCTCKNTANRLVNDAKKYTICDVVVVCQPVPVAAVYSGTSDKGPSEIIGTTSPQRTLVVAPC